MILILDFGSQTTHLIGKRLRDLGIKIEILEPEIPMGKIKKLKPQGIILSGGPGSVYDRKDPKVSPRIFALGVPILGICYGTQLISYLLGGKVKEGKIKEFGKTKIKRVQKSKLLFGLPKKQVVWMSHGDVLKKLPEGFKAIALSEFGQMAAIENKERKIYGFLFHPEVEHTQKGSKMLANFAFRICHLKAEEKPNYKKIIKKIVTDVKKDVGKKNVFLFTSGGIDSTVTFLLLNRALGKKRVLGVHVDTGLLRAGESKQFRKTLNDLGYENFHIEPAGELFLSSLRGIVDPEEKRKIIGSCFLKVQGNVLKKLELDSNDWLLGQGTIYPDFITSGKSKHAGNIKSHHNVGGLPDGNYRLVEPLRYFYKNEVRQMGKILKLPFEFIWREPFPGPGIAVRILGLVTAEKMSIQRKADLMMKNILIKTPWFYKLWHRFPVVAKISENEKPFCKKNVVGTLFKKRLMIIKKARVIIKQFSKEKGLRGIKIKPILLPVKTCGIKGDARAYEHPLALRIEGKKGWSSLPYDLLETLSILLTNKLRYVTRVVLDLTEKPRGWNILVFFRIITSQETMTADWAKLEPYLLNRARRAVMKDRRIDRVFFDITQKPPAMMEWE